MRSNRPARTYLSSEKMRRGRIRNLVGGAGISVALLLRFRELPETIPLHFTLSSEPDMYGPKWSVFIIIAALMGLIALLTWASLRPELSQYPVAVTEENAQELYEVAERMLVRVGTALMIIYLGIGSIYFSFPGLTVVALGMIYLLIVTVLGVKGMFSAA